MKTIKQTSYFLKWMHKLRDTTAKARLAIRLRRLELGHYGDAKAIDGEVSELRFHFGPGYRIYFTERNNEIIILLVGGDKSTQSADIALAKRLASEV